MAFWQVQQLSDTHAGGKEAHLTALQREKSRKNWPVIRDPANAATARGRPLHPKPLPLPKPRNPTASLSKLAFCFLCCDSSRLRRLNRTAVLIHSHTTFRPRPQLPEFHTRLFSTRAEQSREVCGCVAELQARAFDCSSSRRSGASSACGIGSVPDLTPG